jgi:hypothetical protein
MKEGTILHIHQRIEEAARKGAAAVDWLVSCGADPDAAIKHIAREIDELITPSQRTVLGVFIERIDGPLAELLLTRAYARLCQERVATPPSSMPA